MGASAFAQGCQGLREVAGSGPPGLGKPNMTMLFKKVKILVIFFFALCNTLLPKEIEKKCNFFLEFWNKTGISVSVSPPLSSFKGLLHSCCTLNWGEGGGPIKAKILLSQMLHFSELRVKTATSSPSSTSPNSQRRKVVSPVVVVRLFHFCYIVLHTFWSHSRPDSHHGNFAAALK